MIENDNDDDYIYDYDFNILKHNTKKYINIILNVLNRHDNLSSDEKILYYKLKEIYSLDKKISLKQIVQYNEIIIAFHKYYNFITHDNFSI
jgi:hypothetical protein